MKKLRFKFEVMDCWPPLAWLAICNLKNNEIVIKHGQKIETNIEWFCEAIWDGEWRNGNFDKTDIIMGSGARIRGDEVIFVTSGTTVDRLVVLKKGELSYVSNSIPCILNYTNAELDPTYPYYYSDFRSICNGIDRYVEYMNTSQGKLQIIYYYNLYLKNDNFVKIAKSHNLRNFKNYNDYINFIKASLNSLLKNMSDKSRSYVYKPISTLSSGYDSTMISTILKKFGVKNALTFSTARGGDTDTGKEIAEIIGIECYICDRNKWRKIPKSEIPFIAADAYGEEVHLKSAEQYLGDKVLFTGYHGDKVWDKYTKDLSNNIVRGDPAGLALCEYRLIAGFIHCPVPFFGVRQIKQVNEISNSDEMKAWDIPGNYSRPIPRRVVEEAGVPRQLFGIKKKATNVVFWNPKENFLPEESMKSFRIWLKGNQGEWIKRYRIPPLWLSHSYIIIGFFIDGGLHVLSSLYDILKKSIRSKKIEKILYYSTRKKRRVYLFNFIFPWAISIAKEYYKIGKNGH